MAAASALPGAASKAADVAISSSSEDDSESDAMSEHEFGDMDPNALKQMIAERMP